MWQRLHERRLHRSQCVYMQTRIRKGPIRPVFSSLPEVFFNWNSIIDNHKVAVLVYEWRFSSNFFRGCQQGKCIAPNTCSCADGFTMDETNTICIPQCSQQCLNGDCTGPNECTCRKGYAKDVKDPTGTKYWFDFIIVFCLIWKIGNSFCIYIDVSETVPMVVLMVFVRDPTFVFVFLAMLKIGV